MDSHVGRGAPFDPPPGTSRCPGCGQWRHALYGHTCPRLPVCEHGQRLWCDPCAARLCGDQPADLPQVDLRPGRGSPALGIRIGLAVSALLYLAVVLLYLSAVDVAWLP